MRVYVGASTRDEDFIFMGEDGCYKWVKNIIDYKSNNSRQLEASISVECWLRRVKNHENSIRLIGSFTYFDNWLLEHPELLI